MNSDTKDAMLETRARKLEEIAENSASAMVLLLGLLPTLNSRSPDGGAPADRMPIQHGLQRRGLLTLDRE